MKCQHSAQQNALERLLVLNNDPEKRYVMKVDGVVGHEGTIIFERRGGNPSILGRYRLIPANRPHFSPLTSWLGGLNR
jgi:hypothetical protein